MSDSFADLWASSAPTTNTSGAQKNQSLASQATVRPQQSFQTNGGGRKYDAFSVLANSGNASSSNLNSRTSSRSTTPQTGTGTGQNSKGLSAFDDLVSLGGKKSSPLSSQLTSPLNSINSSRERVGLSLGSTSKAPSSSDLWDFDLLSAPNVTPPMSTHVNAHSPSPDPFDFGTLSTHTNGTPSISMSNEDDDLLGDLSKPVEHVIAQRSTPSVSLLNPSRSTNSS